MGEKLNREQISEFLFSFKPDIELVRSNDKIVKAKSENPDGLNVIIKIKPFFLSVFLVYKLAHIDSERNGNNEEMDPGEPQEPDDEDEDIFWYLNDVNRDLKLGEVSINMTKKEAKYKFKQELIFQNEVSELFKYFYNQSVSISGAFKENIDKFLAEKKNHKERAQELVSTTNKILFPDC